MLQTLIMSHLSSLSEDQCIEFCKHYLDVACKLDDVINGAINATGKPNEVVTINPVLTPANTADRAGDTGRTDGEREDYASAFSPFGL